MNLSFKDFSDIAVSWFAALSVIAGGVFGLYKYHQSLEQERVKILFEFMTWENQPPYREAMLNHMRIWAKDSKENIKRLSIEKKSHETAEDIKKRDEEFREFIIGIVKKNKLENDIKLTLQFYRSLAICVKENACSKSLAISFYYKDIKKFGMLYEPYIEQLRKFFDKQIAHEIVEFIITNNES